MLKFVFLEVHFDILTLKKARLKTQSVSTFMFRVVAPQ